jgi:hypothetical protein
MSMDLFDRIDELEQALHKIDQWSKAYPLDVFPEPDLKKARSLLQAGGITLDSISAHCMRHVVEGVGKIAREALAAPVAIQQMPEKWTGATLPQPTAPGTYLAKLVTIDLLGQKITTRPYPVNVVDGVNNARGHRLLVETGSTQPRYRSLDCYDWLIEESVT